MTAPFRLQPHLACFAVHGGDLSGAARLFPRAPRPWLDLSTGINPRPYPLPDLPATVWARLPEAAARAAAEAAAAAAYGATAPTTVVAGPGTQALIQALALTHPGRAGAAVHVLGATYGGHATAWAGVGATVRVAAAVEDLAGAGVAVVVNPNNPDGRLLPPATLRALAATLAERGGLLVVDEAFADPLGPAASLVSGGVPAGAVVLRSFGKMFGLAGVRLGFLLGDATVTGRVRAALGDWAVSGPALALGHAALADRAWLVATRARLAADAAALDAVLEGAGLTVRGGTPLFRLAAHPEAGGMFAQLAAAGILVRPFADRPWLRFGLPAGPAERARLAAALRPLA